VRFHGRPEVRRVTAQTLQLAILRDADVVQLEKLLPRDGGFRRTARARRPDVADCTRSARH
jgi:hypothetical protein